MNRSTKKLIGMALGFFAALTLTIACSHSTTQTTQLPQSQVAYPVAQILPVQAVTTPLPSTCLPALPKVMNLDGQLVPELIGRVQTNGVEYRIYNFQAPSQLGVVQHLVQITNGQCKSLATNATGDDVYLHQVVPLPIAQQLALAQLQWAIDRAGGKEAFQAQLNQALQQLPAGETIKIPEEEQWALQQKGINLPAEIEVIPAPQSR